MDALSLSNPVFKALIGHSSVLITKTLFSAFLTGNERRTKEVFASEEDFAKDKRPERLFSTPNVDRYMRMHRNDMENIFPFIFVASMYVLIKPDPDTAILHFRLFTASRLLHGLVYFFAIRQPARAITWTVGYVVTCSMLYRVFMSGSL